nr:hypothetical protein [Tanacetum cinerariifolium]
PSDGRQPGHPLRHARYALGVERRRHHPVHRGRQRAAVPDRPAADAAAPGRQIGPGARRGGGRLCRHQCRAQSAAA